MYKRFPEILLIDCTHKTNRFVPMFLPCCAHVSRMFL
jgi:hypothetical protein